MIAVTNDPATAATLAARYGDQQVRLVGTHAPSATPPLVEWRTPRRNHRALLGPALAELAAHPNTWGVIHTFDTDGPARAARRVVTRIGGYDAIVSRGDRGFELFAVATTPPFKAGL